MRRQAVAVILFAVAAALMAPAANAAPHRPAEFEAVWPARVPARPCPDVPGARCGSLTVVLDPSDPSAGTIDIGFEIHPARRGRTLGTIVAIEGGPGYATTDSRDWYLDLFDPLLDHRDLLLIDNRGTGTSEPIDCPELQSYEGDYDANVGLCGAQLGTTSDLYGTAFAADDMAQVLDALGIHAVDLYGDSYGSFMAQAFAVRHPDRVRTLVLDGTYPVEDQDPWYPDLNETLRDAFRVVCERDPGCDAQGGDPVDRIARLADALRAKPLTGTAYDADGIRRRVTVDAPILGYLTGVATYGHAVYRELDAAARAYLQDDPDPAPLLRIAAEQILWGDGGPVEEYSEGLYVAAICNDYPQLWDIESPITQRPAQYDAALAELRSTEPNVFHPFTIDDWVASSWAEYTSCIRWPVPSNHVPPVEPGTPYPDVPTLVIVGELDSLTSPAEAEIVAGRFPDSTYVEVANGVHVMTLGDFSRCASDLTIRFVSTGGDAGDTSCANLYQEVRVVEEFPGSLAEVDPAPQGDRVKSSAADRRVAAAAANTVADIFPRWLNAIGFDGVGLRGGSFTSRGSELVQFRLTRLSWVPQVRVSGTVSWDRVSGAIVARIRVRGPAPGELVLRWNDYQQLADLRVTGTIGDRPVALVMPAP